MSQQHDPNCIQTALINTKTSVTRNRDYDEDCTVCADCFDNSDVTPAPGNGQGGSNPLGTSRAKGKISCTDWKYEVTYYYQYTHTCGPCVYFTYGSKSIYRIVTKRSPAGCQPEEDFKCPEGQYAGGVYDC